MLSLEVSHSFVEPVPDKKVPYAIRDAEHKELNIVTGPHPWLLFPKVMVVAIC